MTHFEMKKKKINRTVSILFYRYKTGRPCFVLAGLHRAFSGSVQVSTSFKVGQAGSQGRLWARCLSLCHMGSERLQCGNVEPLCESVLEKHLLPHVAPVDNGAAVRRHRHSSVPVCKSRGKTKPHVRQRGRVLTVG